MRALALALIVLTAPSFACPDLTGTYAVCKKENGDLAESKNLVVTQKNVNRAVEYTVNSEDAATGEKEVETYLADGRVRSHTEREPETGATLTLGSQVSCYGKVVEVHVTLMYENELVSDLVTRVVKDGNKFIQRSTGVNMGEPVLETITCE